MADEIKPEYEKGSFGEQADNANRGIYAPGSFGEAAAKVNAIVPDVNPVDRALARMREKFLAAAPSSSTRAPAQDVALAGRVTRLEDFMTGILLALNDAEITAVCNEDSTITITLTLPGLPGA